MAEKCPCDSGSPNISPIEQHKTFYRAVYGIPGLYCGTWLWVLQIPGDKRNDVFQLFRCVYNKSEYIEYTSGIARIQNRLAYHPVKGGI
jgi:hypothetical protein